MRFHTIHTGNFKLDGGAMFGVVPKQLWSRTNPADNQNLCTWAMRSLLVEIGERLVLIDCGIGDKQSEKFFSHYHLHGTHSLDSSLAQAGFSREDITDVFLTHLHFDHVGGAVIRRADGQLGPRFPQRDVLEQRPALGLGHEPQRTRKGVVLDRQPSTP